jgi:hypothetical protein
MKFFNVLSIVFAVVAAPPVAAISDDMFYDAMSAKTSRIMIPEDREPRVVTAGDTMAEIGIRRTASGAILLEPVSTPPNMAQFQLPAGTKLYRVSTSKAFKACTLIVVVEGLSWPSCVIDDDGDGTFDRVARVSTTSAKPMPSKARYDQIGDIEIPTPSGPAFERKLIYQGMTSDGLKVSYREFSNDMARQAFTEDLVIPMTRDFPQQIAVKGLVFTIFEVTGMGMKYRLDSADSAKGWPPVYSL